VSRIYPWHKRTQSDFDCTRDLVEHMEVLLACADSYRINASTLNPINWTNRFLMISAFLSNAFGSLGDAAKQRELLERSLRIQEAHYGPDHVEVAVTLTNLGNAYGSLGDAAKQRELLERSLRIDEAHYGPDHVAVAVTLTSLGNAYGSLGDAAKQRELLGRAVEIFERNYGMAHSYTQKAKRAYAECNTSRSYCQIC